MPRAPIQQSVVTPRLLVAAIENGWWDPMAEPSGSMPDAPEAIAGTPTIIERVDAATWANLALAPRVIAPADPVSAYDLVAAALGASDPAVVSAVLVGSTVVGLALSTPSDPRDGGRELLAVGVAPAFRRQGVATELLRRHATSPSDAHVTVAERDVVDPLPRETRSAIARRLLERAGFDVDTADEPVRLFDPGAITAHRS